MFYDRFEELCHEKGVRITRACQDMGLSRSLASKWKNTGTEKPSADVLERMSKYFGVSINQILDANIKKEPVIHQDDELLYKLNSRPKVKELVTLLVEMDDEQLAAFLKLFGRP